MSMPSMAAIARAWWTMAAQARAATARTTAAAITGLASSCPASRAASSTRQAGQKPRGRACLVSPMVARSPPPSISARQSARILVATAHPHPDAAVGLIAALRNEIHVVVGDIQHVEPALIGGVRVINLAAVLHEHADARALRDRPRAEPVVVIDLLGLQLLIFE